MTKFIMVMMTIIIIITRKLDAVAAVSVGHAMAGLLGTPLVLALGRDSLCYLLATLTLLWAMGWWILVRESPAEHPRLSDEQRRHLQRAIGPGLSARNAVSCLKDRHTDRLTQPQFNHLTASEPTT